MSPEVVSEATIKVLELVLNPKAFAALGCLVLLVISATLGVMVGMAVLHIR